MEPESIVARTAAYEYWTEPDSTVAAAGAVSARCWAKPDSTVAGGAGEGGPVLGLARRSGEKATRGRAPRGLRAADVLHAVTGLDSHLRI